MRKAIDYFQIALIAINTAVCAVLGTPLLLLGQKRALYISSNLWAFILLKICGVKLTVKGKENVKLDKSRIYICNHESNIDIPCLFMAIPDSLFFLAKKELKKIPFMGWYMMAVGMVFIDRSDRSKAISSLEKAGEEIKNGKSVFSFPEGTRSKNGKVGSFKKGTFLMALQSDLEIVPIAITGANKVIPTSKFEINPGEVRVNIGHPIKPDQWTLETVDEMTQHVKEEVLRLKAEIALS